MTKHLNTALLAVIAGALALPQLPAAHKFIHNNVVYPVQVAWVERARGIFEDEIKGYCSSNASLWQSRNKADQKRQRQLLASAKKSPEPQRADFAPGFLGQERYRKAKLEWSRLPFGVWGYIDRSTAACVTAFTDYRTDKRVKDAFLVPGKTVPQYQGPRYPEKKS